MLTSALFRSFFIALAVMAALHFFALHYFWYWVYWWFDIPLHVLGGMMASALALWARFGHPATSAWNALRALGIAVGSALLVGILWEGFEASTEIINLSEEGLDSLLDLGADLAGGLLVYLMAVLFYKSNIRL